MYEDSVLTRILVTERHSVLKCKGQIKSSYSRKPMVVSCQLGQVGWRSTLGTSTFGLLCLFNGHKLPENAIKRPFMAISGSGGSKWLDLSGYWLDLGGIHPGWSVGAIWTHRNCPGGLQEGQKWPKNAIKRAFMAISGTGGSKWLDLSGSWLDLVGIYPGWSVGAIWTHRN